MISLDNYYVASNYQGASNAADGRSGFVPKAQSADQTKFLRGDGTWQPAGGGGGSNVSALAFAVSDENAYVTTGNSKIIFTAPYNFVLTKVKGGMNQSPVGNSLVFTLSSQTNNNTAATVTIPDGSVVADTTGLTYTINENDRMTINVTQVGSTTPGVGLKVYLIGYYV